MASSRLLMRRVASLSLVAVVALILLGLSGHYAQLTRREEITAFSDWPREIEAHLEAYQESNENPAKRRTKGIADNELPVYLNGKLIVEQLSYYSGQTEAPKIPVLPIDRGPVNDCPSSFGMPASDYSLYRNLSFRHPPAMLEYVRPRDTPPVVILTPISNAAKHLPRYFGHVCSLTYPHSQISLILGEDSSQDDTYGEALTFLTSLQPYFRNVKLFTLKGNKTPWPHEYRHDESYQRLRRDHMARSRNQLLSAGLRDETWVLWLDSDVKYVPPDIIEQLMSAGQDIIVPACMYKKTSEGIVDIYDKNTWRETEESRNFLRKRQKEFLMLEGYAPTMRLYLDALRDGHRVVEIDGVGGCVMLIKADVHRDGLIFPPFIFENEIETEGLGRMAQAMGYRVYGMPYVEVFH